MKTLVKIFFALHLAWSAGLGMSWAHDLPTDVKALTLARVVDQKLVLMMHVPMAAVMREVDWPLHGPYLDLNRSEGATRQAAQLWLVDPLQARMGGQSLPPARLTHARISWPSDTSFQSWEGAHRHLTETAPLSDRDLVPQHQYLDARMVMELPTEDAELELNFHLDRLGLRVQHELRIRTEQGKERLLLLTGPSTWVNLNPGVATSLNNFVMLGVEHILSGFDHLLFIGGLLLGAARLGQLIWTLTGFTVAHSLTLAMAALGWVPERLWFAPAVEWLIALSVLWVSIDVALWSERERRARWAMAMGLIHGLGLSAALREALPMAGEHHALALVGFNLGVELGQLALCLWVWPVLKWLRTQPRFEVMRWILCLAIAHIAWHWGEDRWAALVPFVSTIAWLDWVGEWLHSIWFWLLWLAVVVWATWRRVTPH
mgnify:FL=1